MNKNYKSGFSLAEVCLTLIILGVLFLANVSNVKNIIPDGKISKFKKAYSNIETVVNQLISNPEIYSTAEGFKNTARSTLTTGEVLEGGSKFRNSLKYSLGGIKNLKCEIFAQSGSTDNKCFKTDDGLTWGIPDTDFVSKGVIKIKDIDGDNIKVVPITIYLDYTGVEKPSDAIVIALSYDGKIFVKKDIGNITCSENSNKPQCNVERYINADSIEKKVKND